MNLQKCIGERIHLMRTANGLTQAELANLSDCSKQLVSAWENGRAEITVSSVILLARRLGVDPRWLLLGGEVADKVTHADGVLAHVPLLTQEQVIDFGFSAKMPAGPMPTVTTFREYSKPCFGLLCNDPSTSENFSRGDLLIINPDKKPGPDDYVVALVFRDVEVELPCPQLVVRRIHYMSGALEPHAPYRLMADAAGWGSIDVRTADAATVLGVVVGFQARLGCSVFA